MKHAPVFVISALMLGAGCSAMPKKQGGSGPTLGWKPVVEMRAPAYLFAVDGSGCTVSEKRFKEIKIGDRVFCAWSAPSVAGAAGKH